MDSSDLSVDKPKLRRCEQRVAKTLPGHEPALFLFRFLILKGGLIFGDELQGPLGRLRPSRPAKVQLKADAPDVVTARATGKAAAEEDLKRGILKQKEYPAETDSLQKMKFIKLLKSECGVEWEVVQQPGGSETLRAEVDGYNAVMAGELRQKFGLDIFERIYQKVDEK